MSPGTKLRLIAALAAVTAAPGRAEAPVADPVTVPLFQETCLTGGLSLAAREAALAAGGWQPAAPDELKVKRFEASNPNNIDFAKPETVRLWTRNVGGKEVRAVLATFRAKGAYPTLCGLLVPDIKSSWPYWDAFEAVLKPLGVKANETDLPHYRGYGGKLADGRRSRANIFSRSQVLPGAKNMMHLFIAF